MPIEPPPSRFRLPAAATAGPDDLVAVGGDLAPGTILAAYRTGLFPMQLTDGRLGWWSPQERAILPPDGLKVSRSLRRSLRKYRVSVDADPASVIAGCADPSRPHGWISAEITTAYLELWRLGWVHSIETWDEEGRLAGGLYGVAIGGLFAGESMFSRGRDASKVALVHLVDVLRRVEGTLLDVQWSTPHLLTLGATVVGRAEYLQRLARALQSEDPWSALAVGVKTAPSRLTTPWRVEP